MFKVLDETMSVSPQVSLEELGAAAMQGFKVIISNRPDDEEAGQIKAAEIKRQAEILGMSFVHIPVTHAGFSQLQIDEMVIALSRAQGPVLAFCRSGARSTLLWALAQTKLKHGPDVLAVKAAAQGYDLAPIREQLEQLAGTK